MKFKKYTNFIHLIISVILSFILAYVFLLSDIDIKASYLFSNAIAIIIFIILSITYKNKVKKYKSVNATIKKCEYSFLSNCDLIYEFILNSDVKNEVFHYSQFEKEGKIEKIYISNDNKNLIRERDITMFTKKGLIIFSTIAIIFLILGFYFNTNVIYSSDINDAFGKIFLFKFLNLFPIFSIVILNVINKKLNIKCTAIEGKVIDVDIRTETSFDEVGGMNTTRSHTMGTPKYEYIWNSNKRIYISNSSSTSIPKIGSTKKLFVGIDGIVVREKGEFTFLILFGILLIVFYLIGIIGVF